VAPSNELTLLAIRWPEVKVQEAGGTQRKTNTTAMNINFILSIEATFVKITLQSSKQEDLNDTILVRTHAKTD